MQELLTHLPWSARLLSLSALCPWELSPIPEIQMVFLNWISKLMDDWCLLTALPSLIRISDHLLPSSLSHSSLTASGYDICCKPWRRHQVQGHAKLLTTHLGQGVLRTADRWLGLGFACWSIGVFSSSGCPNWQEAKKILSTILSSPDLLASEVLWRWTSCLSWSPPKTPGRGMGGDYRRQTRRAGPASSSWDLGHFVIFPQPQWLATATGWGSGSEFLGARRVHISSNMSSPDSPPFVPNLQVTLSSWEKDDYFSTQNFPLRSGSRREHIFVSLG